MNIADLQARLRRFAAERDWQPFHTPKNLVTALMVEAAELVEIFQWMTPEESRDAHLDASKQQRIGEEVADVLLYLLQVADHTRLDLAGSVRDKLARNALKYPALRTIEEPPPLLPQPQVHALIDFENVQPSEAQLRSLVPSVTDIWVFHGPNQKRVQQRFAAFGARMTPVPISKTGKNALDFHLSFYMGYIASRNPDAKFVVVSNDKGYEPVLEHARELGFAVARKGIKVTVEDQPGATVSTAGLAVSAKSPKKVGAKAAPKKVAKKVAPTKAPPAKKSAATKSQGSKKAVSSEASPAQAKTKTKQTTLQAKAKTPGSSLEGADVKRQNTPAAMLPKIIESLKKMDKKRPVKTASLRRTVKMLLGDAAGEDDVTRAFNNLVAEGAVLVGSNGGVEYKL